MSSDFVVYLASQSQLDYIKRTETAGDAFAFAIFNGKAGPDVLPGDWPLKCIADANTWGVNHRNCELYHWILNGDPDLVSGAGSIFQTWFSEGEHSAITLDTYGEDYAFTPAQTAELADLVAKVDLAAAHRGYAGYCLQEGHNEPGESESASFVDEFRALGKGLQEAVEKGYGIAWFRR